MIRLCVNGYFSASMNCRPRDVQAKANIYCPIELASGNFRTFFRPNLSEDVVKISRVQEHDSSAFCWRKRSEAQKNARAMGRGVWRSAAKHQGNGVSVSSLQRRAQSSLNVRARGPQLIWGYHGIREKREDPGSGPSRENLANRQASPMRSAVDVP